MKSSFSSGYSQSNRWSFDHHVVKKPSVWSEVISRPHLIVAAIGTVALVGLSGTAIWMALPDGQPQPAMAAVKPKAAAAAPIVEADAAINPVVDQKPKPVEPFVQKAPASAEITAMTVTRAAETMIKPSPAKAVPLLDSENPRWVDPDGEIAAQPDPESAAKAAADAEAAGNKTGGGNSLETAYADDAPEGQHDADATAAIPNFKPSAENPQPDDGDDARSNGRILRSVTMRSRPSSRGGVLGTVPAKTQVQVVSCSQWCEIVYKGKRGFIYKSFMTKVSR